MASKICRFQDTVQGGPTSLCISPE